MRNKRRLSMQRVGRVFVIGRWLVPIVLFLMACFYMLPGASADASLVRSDPPDNAVRDQPLTTVTAWFDLKLQPEPCTLQVFDSGGRQVDLGQGGVDPSDPTLRTMRVSLPRALPPGYYVVRWHAVSDEGVHVGHVTEGQFRFRLTAQGVSQPRGWLVVGVGLVATAGSVWTLFRRKSGRHPVPRDGTAVTLAGEPTSPENAP